MIDDEFLGKNDPLDHAPVQVVFPHTTNTMATFTIAGLAASGCSAHDLCKVCRMLVHNGWPVWKDFTSHYDYVKDMIKRRKLRSSWKENPLTLLRACCRFSITPQLSDQTLGER